MTLSSLLAAAGLVATACFYLFLFVFFGGLLGAMIGALMRDADDALCEETEAERWMEWAEAPPRPFHDYDLN